MTSCPSACANTMRLTRLDTSNMVLMCKETNFELRVTAKSEMLGSHQPRALRRRDPACVERG
jgi:hypothetical protein